MLLRKFLLIRDASRFFFKPAKAYKFMDISHIMFEILNLKIFKAPAHM